MPRLTRLGVKKEEDMRNLRTLVFVSLVAIYVSLFAQESKPPESRDRQGDQDDAQQRGRDSWKKALTDRSKRGTLHDAFQSVRGDSGKWNDEPILQHAPPIGQKPEKVALDDWADQLLKRDFQLTSNDDNWLLLRTRQLDDNDRVWVDQIERRGNQHTVVVNEAIWQGRYSKTFTYYSVFGVNLGKLEPGKYEANWIIKPLAFKEFEGDGRPTDSRNTENWPKDERPTDRQPTELRVTFNVIDKVSSHDAGKPDKATERPNVKGDWSGTWSAYSPPKEGEPPPPAKYTKEQMRLDCKVLELRDGKWQATFEGECGRPYKYTVQMLGRQAGDVVLFTGSADLGEKDGGVYDWIGRATEVEFVGFFTNQKYTGYFRMARR